MIDKLIKEMGENPAAAAALSAAIAQATARRLADVDLPPFVKRPAEYGWKKAGEAAVLLGYKSSRELYTLVYPTYSDGLFRLGIEVQDRRRPGGNYAVYWYHIERCLERLNLDPELR
jgi:hypothetical protein